MPNEGKINAIDTWSAIQKMRSEPGWKLFLDRYAKEGDDILTDLLNINLVDIGQHYTKRDLLTYQLDALGRIGKVLSELETEAKNELDRQKHPPQKGI